MPHTRLHVRTSNLLNTAVTSIILTVILVIVLFIPDPFTKHVLANLIGAALGLFIAENHYRFRVL